LTARRWYAIPGAQAKKEEISMAYLDRESMSEDTRKRYDALTDYEQRALAAILEAETVSIEEALEIVENKTYEFFPDITTMADLARKLVHEEEWYDPYTVAKLDPFIDYVKMGVDLYRDGYCATCFGVIVVYQFLGYNAPDNPD